MDEDEGFDRAPDGITPLVGYRLWRIEDPYGEPAFLPLTRPTPEWTGATRGWVSASCLFGPGPSVLDAFGWVPIPHRVPHERCRCGFYAMKELAPDLVVAASQPAQPGMEGVFVLGRVELAGKVIEHDRGYRAERARIVELIPVRPEQRVARSIARRTGIPLGRPVRVPRTPMHDRVRDWRVAWEATKATTPAERRNQLVAQVLMVAAWLLFRVWSTAHGSGGAP
jgi:hypothetical protein